MEIQQINFVEDNVSAELLEILAKEDFFKLNKIDLRLPQLGDSSNFKLINDQKLIKIISGNNRFNIDLLNSTKFYLPSELITIDIDNEINKENLELDEQKVALTIKNKLIDKIILDVENLLWKPCSFVGLVIHNEYSIIMSNDNKYFYCLYYGLAVA